MCLYIIFCAGAAFIQRHWNLEATEHFCRSVVSYVNLLFDIVSLFFLQNIKFQNMNICCEDYAF